MKLEERETVGVVLVCTDGRPRGLIPVQQKAVIEEDKDTGFISAQSNPHILQLTFGGKVEKGESPKEAVKREAREELGERFAEQFDFSSLILFYMGEFENGDEHFTTCDFVGTLTTKEYEMIELHSGAERMIWISRLDMFRTQPKQSGIDPQKELVMFQDQLRALHFLYSPEAAQTKKLAEIVKILE